MRYFPQSFLMTSVTAIMRFETFLLATKGVKGYPKIRASEFFQG